MQIDLNIQKAIDSKPQSQGNLMTMNIQNQAKVPRYGTSIIKKDYSNNPFEARRQRAASQQQSFVQTTQDWTSTRADQYTGQHSIHIEMPSIHRPAVNNVKTADTARGHRPYKQQIVKGSVWADLRKRNSQHPARPAIL